VAFHRRNLHFKLTFTLGLTLASAISISGCGDSSSYSYEDPTVFQTETQIPENQVPLSPTTSRTIEQNSRKISPESTEENLTIAPLNFSVIRVKLLPLTKIFPSDPYLKSNDNFTIENESGLRILLREGRATYEHKGRRLLVDRTRMSFTLDDREIAVHNQSIADVIPVNANSPTWVLLALNKNRLTSAGLWKPERPSNINFLGEFQIRPVLSENKFVSWSLINYVDFESYVRSVVASEVPSTFNVEALRAQAIAARTFALRQMAMVRCVGVTQAQCTPQTWDVEPSTAYQVYLGVKIQKQVVNQAVDATKGQFLSSNGQPALTMFHASSGGETRSIGEFSCKPTEAKCLKQVNGDHPYLVHAKDPFNGKWIRFGHGVGLPQQSAQSMAVAGKKSAHILQQYYPSTQILNIGDDSTLIKR